MRIPALAEIEQEELKRRAEIYRGSFYEFTKAAWHEVDPSPFVESLYVKVICSHLEWVYHNGQSLVINIPPRHGKSLLVSVLFNAWVWANDLSKTFLCSTRSQPLTLRDSQKARQLIKSTWYSDTFGAVEFSPDQDVKSFFKNTSMGSRQSVSVDSGVTGDGADIRLVDDPVDASDSLNNDALKKANLWFDQTFSTRIASPDYTPVIVVMQRLAESDLSGHLIAKGHNVLCLPLEYDENHPIKSNTPPEAWPDGLVCDWRTKHGELLCPERYSQEFVETQKTTLGPSASGQLNQYPVIQGGDIVTDEIIGYYSDVNGFKKIIITADTAEKTGANNAYSVFGMYGIKHDDPNLYVLDISRGRYEITELVVTASAFWNKHSKLPFADNPGFSNFYIEEKSTGGPLISVMRRERMGVESIERSVRAKKKVDSGQEIEVKQAKKKDERLDEVIINLKLNQGKIMLPSEANYYTDALWVKLFISELKACQRMRPDLGYWDQADTFSDAGFKLLLQAKPKNPLAGLYGQ